MADSTPVEKREFHGVQNQLDDVPLYVNAKELVAADGSVEALELNYIMCFAHNGPHTVGCFPVSLRRLWAFWLCYSCLFCVHA